MAACFAPEGVYRAPGADRLPRAAIAECAAAFFEAFPNCGYGWTVAVAGDGTATVEAFWDNQHFFEQLGIKI